MADIYEMPVPKPPTDHEMDELATLADAWLTRVDVPAGARQVLRVQATVIRKLRVALARAESRAESVEAIAALRRDSMVADAVAAQGECEGSGCPPEEFEYTDEELAKAVRSGRLKARPNAGRCPICNAFGPLDGEVMASHESPDPPLRSA